MTAGDAEATAGLGDRAKSSKLKRASARLPDRPHPRRRPMPPSVPAAYPAPPPRSVPSAAPLSSSNVEPAPIKPRRVPRSSDAQLRPPTPKPRSPHDTRGRRGRGARQSPRTPRPTPTRRYPDPVLWSRRGGRAPQGHAGAPQGYEHPGYAQPAEGYEQHPGRGCRSWARAAPGLRSAARLRAASGADHAHRPPRKATSNIYGAAARLRAASWLRPAARSMSNTPGCCAAARLRAAPPWLR